MIHDRVGLGCHPNVIFFAEQLKEAEAQSEENLAKVARLAEKIEQLQRGGKSCLAPSYVCGLSGVP